VVIKTISVVSQELPNPVLKMVLDGPPLVSLASKYIRGIAFFSVKLFHVSMI
jgi:hypothetical protein